MTPGTSWRAPALREGQGLTSPARAGANREGRKAVPGLSAAAAPAQGCGRSGVVSRALTASPAGRSSLRPRKGARRTGVLRPPTCGHLSLTDEDSAVALQDCPVL